MTKEEEQAIIAQRNALLEQARLIEAPLEAERKARYAREAAERFAREKATHDANYGSLVGKVVTRVAIKLGDDSDVQIEFHDGTTLRIEAEGENSCAYLNVEYE